VFGGELTSTDVLSLARSTFPRNNMMMLYDATTLSRLRTDVVVKLEPTSTGHFMIVTPLLDAADYRATNEFKQKVGPESGRVDCMVISSHCLVDNLQSQMASIQRQVEETKHKIARSFDETEELGAEISSWESTLSGITCSDGSDAWSALAIYPDSVDKIRARVSNATSDFNQVAAEVGQEISRLQANITEHSKRMEEAVEKFHRSPSSEHHGGVSSGRNSAGGGSAGSASSALMAAGGGTAGGSAQLMRIVKFVDTFRKQSSLGIAQWRTTVTKLRALIREAEPVELKTVRTFTAVLPMALEELQELTIKRCAVFRAATAMSTHVEQSYLKVVDQWRSWSSKYAAIYEPLQRVAPQEMSVFKDLPMFLFPRNMCRAAGAATPEIEQGIELQCTSLLTATAATLQPYFLGSDGSVSSPGLQSRQCTATPVHHFSSPDDASTSLASASLPNSSAKDQQDRISELEAQVRQLQVQLDKALESISAARREHITVVGALEHSLSRSEGKAQDSEAAVSRLAAQLAEFQICEESAPHAANAGNRKKISHASPRSPTPLTKAMGFLEYEFLNIANTLGAANAFGIETRSTEVDEFGRWSIPPPAPELLAVLRRNQFHVRMTDPASARDVTLRLNVALHLKSKDGDGAPYEALAEIYDGDLEHQLSEVLLDKTCVFQQQGEGASTQFIAPFLLPTDNSIPPELRGKSIRIVPEAGTKCKLGVPMTIIQVNSVSEMIGVNATCSANLK
jgi:hypothetical protein